MEEINTSNLSSLSPESSVVVFKLLHYIVLVRKLGIKQMMSIHKRFQIIWTHKV